MKAAVVEKIRKDQKKDRARKNDSPFGNTYQVILDIFEGPLDLLIHLIKKEKINIYDVSISKITEQYLAFLETMHTLDFTITGEFLTMAATLIYIKSRTLLRPKDIPEEEDLLEEKTDLIERLVEYQKYKNATEQLMSFAQERSKVFARPSYNTQHTETVFSENTKAEISELVLAIQSLLKKIEKKEPLIPIKINEIDIKDKIQQILIFLRYNKNIHWEKILEGNYEKQNIIVTFLALLELVKNCSIQLYQSMPFGELKIYGTNIFSKQTCQTF